MDPDKVLRLPSYAVDREQAREAVSAGDLSRGDSVELDLRDMTFAGMSFSSEIASKVAEAQPSRVTFRGGNKRLRSRITKFLIEKDVNVLLDDHITA